MRLYQTGPHMHINLDLVQRVGLLDAGGMWHVCLWYDSDEYMVVDTLFELDAAEAILAYWVTIVGGVIVAEQ